LRSSIFRRETNDGKQGYKKEKKLLKERNSILPKGRGDGAWNPCIKEAKGK